MLELIQIKKFESGEIILNKGDQSEFAHLILYGEVYLFDSSQYAAPPSKEDLAKISRANSTTMKKLQVGGVVGSEAFSSESSTIC